MAAPTSAVQEGGDAAPAQPAPETTGMGDIVVTAQRRSESLQRVPAAVSALSGASLQARNIVNVQDFGAIAPNVTFGELNGFARINIRGIGNQNYFTGGDPSVTMYVDGAVISQAAAQMSAFFDLERVEVLRGPQGTLYGRNATGGSVNLITRKPTDTLSGYANLTLGNYDLVQVEGAVGGPVAQDLAARVAVFRQRRGGYGINEFDGRDVDDADRTFVRGELLYGSGANSFLLTGQYGRERDADYQVHVYGNANAATGGRTSGQLLGGSLATNPRNVNSEAPLRNRRDTYSITGDGKVSLNDAFKLRSITNYRQYKQDFISDIEGTQARYAAVQQIIDSKQFSQELQVNYDIERLSVVTGLYYFHENIYGNNNLGGPGPTVAPPTGGPPGLFYTALIGDVKVNAFGAFAQGTYKLLPNLGLTGGIRYSDEKRRGEGTFQGPTTGVAPIATPRSIHDTNVSIKTGIDWNVSSTVLAYASYSNGFKSGVILVGGSDPAARPEKVRAYEVGLKADFFDHRLRTNLAAFTYSYRDLQITQLLVGASVPTVTNAASARSKGVEAEVTIRPVNRLVVDIKAAYLDATFRNFQSRDPRVAPPAVSPVVNLSGNRLPYAPKVSGTFHVDYRLPLGALEEKMLATPGIDIVTTSRTDFSAFNQDDLAQGGNTKIDISLRLETPNHRYSLSAFVKNATNRFTFANKTVGGGTSTNRAIYGVNSPPRTFGVTLGANF